jgi:outer membrane murein-binding lipoprotein Lpp
MTEPQPNGTAARLDRIERLLEKLDDKLDIKADRSDVQLLSARVAILELDLVKTAVKWDELMPRVRTMEADVGALQHAATVAKAKAEEAKELYEKQGFKLDTTAKKLAAVTGVVFVILNTIDTIQNLIFR